MRNRCREKQESQRQSARRFLAACTNGLSHPGQAGWFSEIGPLSGLKTPQERQVIHRFFLN